MDGKFLLQDLAELLAEAEGLQKNEAQSFVRVFFDTVTRGLEEDKLVKVKGLGTFKLVDVDSRESVNVNTGERFLIDGHAKITFTPDNSLKDMVNRPFSHFETVVLNDDVTDEDLEEVDRKFEDSAAAEEPVALEGLEDFLAEEPVIPAVTPVAENFVPTVTEPVVTPVEPAAPVVETVIPVEPAEPESADAPVEEPVAPVVETPVESAVEPVAPTEPAVPVEPIAPVVPAETPAEPVKEQPADATSTEPVLVKLVDPVNVNVSPEPMEHAPEPEEETKNNHFRNIWIVLCIVALLLGYLLGYFNVFSPKNSYRPSIIRDTVFVQKIVRDTIEVEKVVPNELVAEPKAEQPKTPESKAEAKPTAKPAEPVVDSSIPQLKGGAYQIVGTQATYTLRGGETIRIIAERYFGSRQMAPYIALYNNIPNPDVVAAGTVLKIPELKLKKK